MKPTQNNSAGTERQLRNELTHLKSRVYEAYQNDQDSGGAYLILERSAHYDKIDWEYCKACDTERPTVKGEHECMICGQTTTPIAGTEKQSTIAGQWKVDYEAAPDVTIWDGEECIATVWAHPKSSEYAKLIASAPELKAANESLRENNERLLEMLKNIYGLAEEMGIIMTDDQWSEKFRAKFNPIMTETELILEKTPQ